MSDCHLECRNCAGCLHEQYELPERMTQNEHVQLGHLMLLREWSAVREVQLRSRGEFDRASAFNDKTQKFERELVPLAERAFLELMLYGEIEL